MIKSQIFENWRSIHDFFIIIKSKIQNSSDLEACWIYSFLSFRSWDPWWIDTWPNGERVQEDAARNESLLLVVVKSLLLSAVELDDRLKVSKSLATQLRITPRRDIPGWYPCRTSHHLPPWHALNFKFFFHVVLFYYFITRVISFGEYFNAPRYHP